jgi:hypothetical protein
MRAIPMMFLFAAVSALSWPASGSAATGHPRATTTAHTDIGSASDLSAQSRRRPRVRIYREDERGVYPSYFPGSNAVRDCNVSYVQEFRPSGTVIVPNMKCFWRRP